VYDNLKKTILYLLPAGSFSELMPIVLNVIIGVPQMLSNIQMILICVGVSGPLLPGCTKRAYMIMTWCFVDGCPSRAEYVFGAARKRIALPPAP
jgi:hypothetical protein